LWSDSRFLTARCAGSVLPMPVVQRVVRRLVVLSARCAGVVQRPVVRIARPGQPDRVLGVVQIEARYATRDLRCACYRPNARRGRRGTMQVWSADAIGTRTTDAGAPNKSFQPTASRARSLGLCA